jgi:hypothetical protein
MKFCKTISALALLAVTALSAAAHQKQTPVQPNVGTAPSGVPVLVIESFTHDFGEVKPGDPLRFAFKIKNEGKVDLLINSVTPG